LRVREVKPNIISLFADIAMAIEGDFERYATIVLMMLQQAGLVNITTDDDDLIDYVNSLREAILEAYTGIIQVATS
jgi:importin subunit beta-1